MQSEVQRAVWLAKHAPRLRAGDLERINDIYPAYLFRVRKTGEVWTTCCGHHVHADETKGEVWRAVMEAPHHREPDRWDGYTCHMGAMSAPPTKKPDWWPVPSAGSRPRSRSWDAPENGTTSAPGIGWWSCGCGRARCGP